MNCYEEFKQTLGREPTYDELKEKVKLVEDQASQLEAEEFEQARDQVEEILAAFGWKQEPKPPVPVKLCGHLREDSRYCRSIAVKDRDFCPYHLKERGRLLRMAQARARRQRLPLQLPPLEDLYAVQVSIGQVLNALLSGQLDKGLGGTVLYGLQQAATNLCRPVEVWEESRPFESGEQLALPGLEEEFGLPQGIDLNTPPEKAFPETEPAAVSEERANLMEDTPTDIELMEIRQREGPEAAWRKLKELDAVEDRRYKKAQTQLAHARHVVRAAAQNAARETYFVARSQADLAGVEAEEQAEADAGKRAGAPPLSNVGAPPLSAAVADRVGDEAGESRKEPQPAAPEADGQEKKLG